MAVKKQPESEAGELSAAAQDWSRQFLKVLELALVDACLGLPADATDEDYRLAAVRAVKLTLMDSGGDETSIAGLFGLVAMEDEDATEKVVWNRELNKRRFELIDRDIQGVLSSAERLELAGLTQLMRAHVDSETDLPFEGARKLHQRLSGLDTDPARADR